MARGLLLWPVRAKLELAFDRREDLGEEVLAVARRDSVGLQAAHRGGLSSARILVILSPGPHNDPASTVMLDKRVATVDDDRLTDHKV